MNAIGFFNFLKMRRLFFGVLACLSVTMAQAQKAGKKAVNYHLISLEDKDDVPLEYRFYVVNVYDGRQYKDNIGTVQKSIMNSTVLARFEKPFETEIGDYLLKAFPKKDGAEPISLRINDLYVSERTEASAEFGYATVVADIVVQENGQDYIVATYSATIEGEAMDVTAKHDERIKKALVKCIAKHEVALPEDLVKVAFNPDAPVAQKKNFSEIAKGVYISSSDIVNEKPLDSENFYLKNEKEKYYIVNKVNGRKAEDYFAYCDGESVYVNVSRYAESKYYAKADIVGGRYYLDNIVYNPINTDFMLKTFGLIGGVVSRRDDYCPMLLDPYSGQPFFLSHREIKTMLEPQADLLKEYKEGNKNSNTVKGVLRKYYARIDNKQ